MKFFQSKTAAYLTDAICALLLSASLLLVLLAVFGFYTSFGLCFAVMLVDLAVVFVLSRRWWVLPVFLLSLAALALLIASIFGSIEALVSFLSGFFNWGLAGLPKTSSYATLGGYLTIQLIIALPIAGLSLLYFRKLFVFGLLPVLVLGILGWLFFYYGPEFYLMLALMFVLLFMSMAKMSARRVNKALTQSEKIAPALLPITALLLTAVVLLFAFSFAPKNDGEWRVKGVNNAVQDVRDLFNARSGEGPLEGDLGLTDSGFSAMSKDLGGNLSLDNIVVMKVTTDTPHRLTGAIFETYDGTSWYRTDSLRRYRFKSSLWREKRNDIFLYDSPNRSSQAQALFDQITQTATYKITYYPLGRTLFYTGQITNVESQKFDFSEVYFNNAAELFIAVPQKNLRYTLTTTIFNTDAADFDQNMLALEALTLSAEDPQLGAIKTTYLNLPDALPQAVYDIANQITAEYESPYEKAIAIEEWLNASCLYTLTPGDPPAGQDFVAAFLESKEGYCEYFASAMTILARCADLPARYVTGYALNHNPSMTAQDSYIATHATAHAWTEIYFQGIGWIPFDATGWNFEEEGTASTEETVAATLPEEESASIIETTEAIDRDDRVIKGLSTGLHALLFALAGLFVAAVLLALIRFFILSADAHTYYRRLCRKYPDIKSRIDVCYDHIFAQTTYLHVTKEPSDTLSQYIQRVDRVLGSKAMSEACESVLLMRFALIEPSDSDLKRLCAFSADLEKHLKTELGFLSYLWRRLLIGK